MDITITCQSCEESFELDWEQPSTEGRFAALRHQRSCRR